jgi:hypothetical protein
MTSYSGYKIIRCPHCGTESAERAFASINFSAQEYWTDGQRVNSLAPTDESIRNCNCGSFYLSFTAKTLGHSKAPNFEGAEIPIARVVSDAGLQAALLSKKYDSDCELAIRKRLNRYFNDPYRDIYRHHRSRDKGSFPEYEPSAAQKENLILMIELMDQDSIRNVFELVECHREVGAFDIALDHASSTSIDNQTQRMLALQRQLIANGIRNPVRFRL